MFIVPITRMEPVGTLDGFKSAESVGGSVAGQPSFADVFKEVVKNADNEVNKMEALDMQVAAGDIDDLHTALIQAEQTAAAIEFTTQLTSKAVNAYNQIMSMQV